MLGDAITEEDEIVAKDMASKGYWAKDIAAALCISQDDVWRVCSPATNVVEISRRRGERVRELCREKHSISEIFFITGYPLFQIHKYVRRHLCKLFEMRLSVADLALLSGQKYWDVYDELHERGMRMRRGLVR